MTIPRLVPAAALLLSFILAGCGGGATSDVKVTMKPSESKPAAGETATNDAPAADGAATPAGSGQPGRLTGTITYDGAPPSLSPAAQPSQIKPEEANVCRLDVIGNDSLVVNPDNKGVQYIFVYLEKAPTRAPTQELEAATFDNKSCRFNPHALFVQVGQTVNVLNSDPIAHNTHTYPSGRNTAFNQVVQAGGAPLPFVYNRAEQQPVEVKCDFHVWMKGYHLVLDHPWGAVTDADGRFELPELPPGDYQFRIWHERAGFLERSRKVKINGDQTLDIAYGPSKFARFEGPRPKSVYVASR